MFWQSDKFVLDEPSRAPRISEKDFVFSTAGCAEDAATALTKFTMPPHLVVLENVTEEFFVPLITLLSIDVTSLFCREGSTPPSGPKLRFVSFDSGRAKV